MKTIFTILFIAIGFSLLAQSSFKSQIAEHRSKYKADFKKEDYSPFFKHPELLNKLKFYPAKKEYNVAARIELTPDAKPFDLATYSGKTKPFRQYAWAYFTLDGKETKLAIYQSLNTIKIPGYQDYLFLPFKDVTSGNKTYGGGRYLDFTTGDISNSVLQLDFNKAYNPYCAYSDGYNCPIPPVENHLDLAIKAGEKMYKGQKLTRP